MDFESRSQADEMLSSGEEDNTDERKHNQLLDAISSLDGKKRSKLSQRTVLSNQISEFNFTSSKDNASLVRLNELVGSLKESASHGELKKQLRTIDRHRKTVSTPLPRHEKEKIDRATAYETTSEDISKWEPIVKKNRTAEQLEFPLQKQSFRIVTTDQLVKRFRPRTPLERQVAELLQGSDSVVQNKQQELTPAEQKALQAMDLQEAKERRMELMKHRALLSYKEAKAKRQKKIKSKKYHRILKKEKMKNEKKQLDKLQNEDPEGYLDKLNQVEKDRAQERVSLKHRGGSKYAKRQMIYAKYDDRARQEVQDMLQKSRALTKKVDVESDTEDDKFPDSGVAIDIGSTELNLGEASDNPWMAKPTSAKPISSFTRPATVRDLDHNEDNEMSDFSSSAKIVNDEVINDEDNEMSDFSSSVKIVTDEVLTVSEDESTDSEVEIVDEQQESDTKAENEMELMSVNVKSDSKQRTEVHDLSSLDAKQPASDKNAENVFHSNASELIDEIFDTASGNNQKSVNNKRRKNKNKQSNLINKSLEHKDCDDTISVNHDSDNEDANKSDSNDKLMDATDRNNGTVSNGRLEDEDEGIMNSESVSRKRTLEDYDNMLADDAEKESSKKLKVDITKTKKVKESETHDKTVEKVAYVDPKKLLTMETKIRQVGSGPNIIDNEGDSDVDAEEQQRLTIAQAFADDDVIEEFSREKGEIVGKDQPKDIDLTLPGWGSWGGEGIRVSKKKRTRFIIKAPPPLPRRDEHLGHVILNESRMTAVSKHMVHEIPFPYRNVEQFEKSIRAPLGKTWNPESVHKDLVKPKVVTGIGKIITPIDKSEVMKHQKNKTKNDGKEAFNEKKTGYKNKHNKPLKRTDLPLKGNIKKQFMKGTKGSDKQTRFKKRS